MLLILTILKKFCQYLGKHLLKRIAYYNDLFNDCYGKKAESALTLNQFKGEDWQDPGLTLISKIEHSGGSSSIMVVLA